MYDLYYKTSGKFSISSILFLAVAIAFMPLLATVYSAVLWYNPFIYISFAATLVYAYLVAILFSHVVMRWGKVRNVFIGVIFGLIASSVSFIASWSTFFAIMKMNFQNGGVDAQAFMDYALAYARDPMAIWATMQDVVVDGLWTIKSLELKGPLLWGIWAIEGLIIFCSPFFFVAGYAYEPFCEDGRKWAKRTEFKHKAFAPCRDVDDLVKRLEAVRGVAPLMDLDVMKLEEDDNRPHMSVVVHSCTQEAYLTLENHAGEDELEDDDLYNETVVDCLRISLQDADQLKALLE
ncbi:MAG: hypothetical protein ACWA40_00960 [Planktomarina sp.]